MRTMQMALLVFFFINMTACDKSDDTKSDPDTPPSAGTVLYVDDDGSNFNSGLDPDKPLKTISAALARVQKKGMTIQVAPGRYGKDNGDHLPLTLKSNMSLVGSGGTGPTGTRSIIDASGMKKRLVLFDGEEHDIVIRGFEFRGGYVRESGGGAMLLRDGVSGVVIKDNLFSNNAALGGGALVISECEDIIIEDNVFQENLSHESDAGAIFLLDCSPVIRNNLFEQNISAYGGGGIQAVDNPDPFEDTAPVIESNTFRNNIALFGGGVYMFEADGVLLDNIFENNEATDSGGAFLAWGPYCNTYLEGNQFVSNRASNIGGAVEITMSADVIFFNNIFRSNSADQSGGAYIALFDGHALLKNCLFHDNSAVLYGGAMTIFGANTTIQSCTISGNMNPSSTAVFGPIPGIAIVHNGRVELTDSIIWEQNGADIFIDMYTRGTAIVSYSDTEETWPGTGNISRDPRFVNGPGGGFYLLQSLSGEGISPCVDKGSTTSENAGLNIGWTTNPVQTPDSGTLDLGYHYPTSQE